MLGTIILDTYRPEEADALATAIASICSPDSNQGWSSHGLYCYWDTKTHECLYIGMTNDLGRRFNEHNGLCQTTEHTGHKQKEINAYFRNGQPLGFAIMSPDPFFADELAKGNQYIRNNEGAFLEAYKREIGRLPPWNKAPGAKAGRELVRADTFQGLIMGISGNVTTASFNFVARKSIRELDSSGSWFYFEENLHAVRVWMLMGGPGKTFDDAFSDKEKQQGGIGEDNIFTRIRNQRYMELNHPDFVKVK